MSNYENLKVWHRAVDLAVSIYRLTQSNKLFVKDFGLKDQLQRSSVSISSNISEGNELGTDKQAIRQFFIAKGSAAEVYTQLIISCKIGYITEDDCKYYLNECKGISSMLINLIKSRYIE
jgi:four helix bundle protein